MESQYFHPEEDEFLPSGASQQPLKPQDQSQLPPKSNEQRQEVSKFDEHEEVKEEQGAAISGGRDHSTRLPQSPLPQQLTKQASVLERGPSAENRLRTP